MDIIDRLTASQVEDDDTIIILSELVTVTAHEDDGDNVCIEGVSLDTGENVIYTVPFDTIVDLIGA